MIKVLAIMPTYDASGNVINVGVSVEMSLENGEPGNANFTLGPDEIELLTISEKIRQKIIKGLSDV